MEQTEESHVKHAKIAIPTKMTLNHPSLALLLPPLAVLASSPIFSLVPNLVLASMLQWRQEVHSHVPIPQSKLWSLPDGRAPSRQLDV